MYTKISSISGLSLVMSFICFLAYGYVHTYTQDEENFPDGDANIAFVLDVSESMQVRDMSGNSRLEVAKQKILQTLQENPGAEFSLSIFAGESQRVLPFTQDISLIATFLSGIDSENLTKQGTEISLALEDALISFGTDKTGTLVMITDGADDSVLLETELRESLGEQNLDIKIVGVGTEDGGNILEGIDPFGRPIYKTYQGQLVVSNLNDFGLKVLAGDVGGKYYDISENLEIGFGNTTPVQRDTKTFVLLLLSIFFWIIFLSSSAYPVFKKY
ncbi:VWA domain-containing protein [Candidatus Gracilibacteria bacterium]|nr:VWA domain-containing protein [Candidatus Gracilibacteria bacterium]